MATGLLEQLREPLLRIGRGASAGRELRECVDGAGDVADALREQPRQRVEAFRALLRRRGVCEPAARANQILAATGALELCHQRRERLEIARIGFERGLETPDAVVVASELRVVARQPSPIRGARGSLQQQRLSLETIHELRVPAERGVQARAGIERLGALGDAFGPALRPGERGFGAAGLLEAAHELARELGQPRAVVRDGRLARAEAQERIRVAAFRREPAQAAVGGQRARLARERGLVGARRFRGLREALRQQIAERAGEAGALRLGPGVRGALEQRAQRIPVLGLAVQAFERRRHDRRERVEGEGPFVGERSGLRVREPFFVQRPELGEHGGAAARIVAGERGPPLEQVDELLRAAETRERVGEGLHHQRIVGRAAQRALEPAGGLGVLARAPSAARRLRAARRPGSSSPLISARRSRQRSSSLSSSSARATSASPSTTRGSSGASASARSHQLRARSGLASFSIWSLPASIAISARCAEGFAVSKRRSSSEASRLHCSDARAFALRPSAAALQRGSSVSARR